MVQSIKSPMNILSKNFLVNFPDEKVDWFSEIWRVREWFDVTGLVFYWVEECDLKYFFVGHSVQLKRPLSSFKQNHRKWFSLSDKSQICADNMSGLSFCPPYFLTTHPQQLIKQSFLSLNHSPASVQTWQARQAPAIIQNPTTWMIIGIGSEISSIYLLENKTVQQWACAAINSDTVINCYISDWE